MTCIFTYYDCLCLLNVGKYLVRPILLSFSLQHVHRRLWVSYTDRPSLSKPITRNARNTYIHTLFKPIRVYIVNEYKNSRIHSDAMAERASASRGWSATAKTCQSWPPFAAGVSMSAMHFGAWTTAALWANRQSLYIILVCTDLQTM